MKGSGFDIDEGKESPRQEGIGKAPGAFIGMAEAKNKNRYQKAFYRPQGPELYGHIDPEVPFFQVARGQGRKQSRCPGKEIRRDGDFFSGKKPRSGSGQGDKDAGEAEGRKADAQGCEIRPAETERMKTVLFQEQHDKEDGGNPKQEGIPDFPHSHGFPGKEEDEKKYQCFRQIFNSCSF
jgi:hypothetical protein